MDLKESTKLGQQTEYPDHYDASLLTPIPRAANRGKLKLQAVPAFQGVDLWNAYELSWLNAKGKPEVAVGVYRLDCQSLNIIESKSFKLYLNSFNQTRFDSREQVQAIMQNDLQTAAEGEISVRLYALDDSFQDHPGNWDQAECIDSLDVECTAYQPQPEILTTEPNAPVVSETLCSHLLKSNCPVTGQPDWATLYIRYQGVRIDRESLLKYIVSMRGHQDFHEHCVESIYVALMQHCEPDQLAVYARYTRRGGLDINPLRSNYPEKPDNVKLIRQ